MAEIMTAQGLVVGLIEPTNAPEQEEIPAQEAPLDAENTESIIDKPKRTPGRPRRAK